jgi:hypothetical protein
MEENEVITTPSHFPAGSTPGKTHISINIPLRKAHNSIAREKENGPESYDSGPFLSIYY